MNILPVSFNTVTRRLQNVRRFFVISYLLYSRAQILFLHSEDYDAARAAQQEYLNRNPVDPNLVMNRTFEYIYSVMNDERDRGKIIEITYILNRGIAK